MVAPIPCDLTLTFQKIWDVLEFLKDNWISALEDARVHQAWLHAPGLVSVGVRASRRTAEKIHFLGALRVVYDLPESFVSLLQKIWMQSWLKGDARLFGKSGKRSFGACSATLALILILKLHEMWILCTGWLSRVGRKLTGKSPSGRRVQRHILPSLGKLGPNYSCDCCSGFWPFWPQLGRPAHWGRADVRVGKGQRWDILGAEYLGFFGTGCWFYLLCERNFPVAWPEPSQPGIGHLRQKGLKDPILYRREKIP